MAGPEFYFHNGRTYKPVNIQATGQWQLMRMEKSKCYILVHPNGKQAWFSDDQINEIVARNSTFHYTKNALRDLEKLAKLGLVPFHVDADFDPTGFSVKL